jgi:hypothetical protein
MLCAAGKVRRLVFAFVSLDFIPLEPYFRIARQSGAIEAMELSDLDDLGPFQKLEAELAEFLAEDDVEHLAAAMDPGSVAGVLVYENLWAAPFAAAVRRAGGQLIANGRIPAQAIVAALEADEVLESEGA